MIQLYGSLAKVKTIIYNNDSAGLNYWQIIYSFFHKGCAKTTSVCCAFDVNNPLNALSQSVNPEFAYNRVDRPVSKHLRNETISNSHTLFL